jgi:hypothetical protein
MTMAHIIVETNLPKRPTDAELEQAGAKLIPCIEERHARWIRSYLSIDRKRRICHFEAPDAESVREAYRSAGLPVGEVWTAGAVMKIEDYPDFLAKREQLRARLAGK